MWRIGSDYPCNPRFPCSLAVPATPFVPAGPVAPGGPVGILAILARRAYTSVISWFDV